jgi:hypothetical protein
MNSKITKPFGEAVALYLNALADLCDVTHTNYKRTLGGVFAPLNPMPMADVKTADIKTILADTGNTSRRMHIRNLKAFWKWATNNKGCCEVAAIAETSSAPNNKGCCEVAAIAETSSAPFG